MDTQKRKEWLRALKWVIALFVVIFYLLYLDYKDSQILKNDGVSTIGTITTFGRKNSIEWTYPYEGKIPRIIDNNDRFLGLQKGEKFTAVYDPNNYKNARINLSEPVIDFAVDTVRQYKIIRPIQNNNVCVAFSYVYQGKNYERQQVLPRKGNWEAVDSFYVLVNKSNSKVAYLKVQEFLNE